VRWDADLSITALRFSNVMTPDDYPPFSGFQSDPASRKWNLRGYIDARDGAQAIMRALDAGLPGFDRFIIAAADTVMERSSASLMAEYFPYVELRRELEEYETLLGIDPCPRDARVRAEVLLAGLTPHPPGRLSPRSSRTATREHVDAATAEVIHRDQPQASVRGEDGGRGDDLHDRSPTRDASNGSRFRSMMRSRAKNTTVISPRNSTGSPRAAGRCMSQSRRNTAGGSPRSGSC
jgi:hypothetical protein